MENEKRIIGSAVKGIKEMDAVKLAAELGKKDSLNVNPEEWKDLSEEEKAAKTAKIMELVDKMNREMLHDNKLGLFLYKLNYAVMRTGQPIPRNVCELAGVDKQTLKKLTRKGFLNEFRVRNSKTGAELVAYTVADGITFYGNGENFRAVEVVPAEDAFDALEDLTPQEEVAEAIEELKEQGITDLNTLLDE